MHHIRLKRAQNVCNGLSQEEGEKALSENKFSASEIKEFYGIMNEETVKTETVSVKATTSKAKMALKDLETPEGWAKYKELALGAAAYLMCEHLKIQVTRVLGFRHDAQLNREQFISHIQLDKEKAVGETLISPIMAETLNSQLEGNSQSMVYYVQKSIVC